MERSSVKENCFGTLIRSMGVRVTEHSSITGHHFMERLPVRGFIIMEHSLVKGAFIDYRGVLIMEHVPVNIDKGSINIVEHLLVTGHQ
jgi:hypothetical protein